MTDLCTLVQVKTFLGYQPSNVADDAALQALVTAYSDFARSYCNRDFDVRAYTDIKNGRGQSLLMLPNFPVQTVTSLTIDGVAVPAQVVWGAAGYRVVPSGVVLDAQCFTRGTMNVQISYTAGYPVIPTDLSQAIVEMVALRNSLRDKQGWTSMTLAGQTVALSTKDMPAAAATILNQYKAVVPL